MVAEESGAAHLGLGARLFLDCLVGSEPLTRVRTPYPYWRRQNR
jgi:hypothetical protein